MEDKPDLWCKTCNEGLFFNPLDGQFYTLNGLIGCFCNRES